MSTYDLWEDYNSRYKSWDKITKALIVYLERIQENREHTEVEREVRDGIPYLKLTIETYYQNKPYAAETRLTMSMLEYIDQKDFELIIDKFVVTFRKRFLENPVVEKVDKTSEPEPRKRHTTLETDNVSGVM